MRNLLTSTDAPRDQSESAWKPVLRALGLTINHQTNETQRTTTGRNSTSHREGLRTVSGVIRVGSLHGADVCRRRRARDRAHGIQVVDTTSRAARRAARVLVLRSGTSLVRAVPPPLPSVPSWGVELSSGAGSVGQWVLPSRRVSGRRRRR